MEQNPETLRGMPVSRKYVRARGLVQSQQYKFAIALQFESVQDAMLAKKSLSHTWNQRSNKAPHILVWVGDVLAFETVKDVLLEYGVRNEMFTTGEFDCSIPC